MGFGQSLPKPTISGTFNKQIEKIKQDIWLQAQLQAYFVTNTELFQSLHQSFTLNLVHGLFIQLVIMLQDIYHSQNLH